MSPLAELEEYGPGVKIKGTTVTAPRTTFPNFDALISSPKEAADALDQAGGSIATSVCADLRRSNANSSL